MILTPLRWLVARLRSRLARTGASGGEAVEWRSAPGGIDAPGLHDWVWRPAPWARPMTPAILADAPDGTRLTSGAHLFHDCPTARITVEQGPASDGTSHPLHIHAPGFSGMFLSLALDLPEGAARGLRRSHIVGVSTRIRMDRPTGTFVRLNIRQGPNTEQRVAALEPGGATGAAATVEFDLGFDAINPVRLEAAWIDLIFEEPPGDPIRIDDLTVTRRPRADL